MIYLYNVLVLLLVFLAVPVLIFRWIREDGFGERLKQSLGFLPYEKLDKVAKTNCIWLHAASVGEIVAASPIVKEIRREFPDQPILLSVVTATGYTMAQRIVKEADAIIYFPLDLPLLSRRVVRWICPKVFLLVETELWPNFLRAAKSAEIPVMMVNGRISDKSVKRYQYLFGVLRDMLATVRQYCMQSTIDAQYIIKLGADPRKVVVTGNTKFDQNYTDVTEEEKEDLLNTLFPAGHELMLVAGSTHKGEEELLFQALAKVRERFPQCRLVVAPREISRAEEIVDLAVSYRFRASRRTAVAEGKSDVIVLDTIGELGKVYSLADVVYVGGSLIARGGHNLLEPAAHGKPIVVGPHMFNFKDSYSLLTECGACRTVYDMEGLGQAFIEILGDQALRDSMGQSSRAAIEANQGAAKKSVEYLTQLLAEIPPPRKKKVPVIREIHDDHGGDLGFKEGVQLYLYQLVHGEKRGVIAAVLLGMLRVFSFLYGLGVSAVLFLYRQGFLKQHKLPCKVISLGNITVGGTGKTPTAQKLAASIRDMGHKVVVLNRGYRAAWRGQVGIVSDGKTIFMTANEAGDEAYLLAKNLPGVPVVIGKDRAVTGEYAVKEFQADIIILDDGYQHWQLARDFDVVLIDTLNMFGNKRLLPRGTLREPLSNLDRAHAFLLTKVDQSTGDARESIKNTIQKHNDKALVVESIHSPKCFMEIEDWYKGARSTTVELATIYEKPVVALSAIGNPTSFEQTITDLHGQLVGTIRYPDHHDYSMVEMLSAMQAAVDRGACAIITTDKDAVKIPSEFIHSDRPLPLYVLLIEVRCVENYEPFMEMIRQVADGKDKQEG